MANLSDFFDIGLNEGSDTLQSIANAVTKLPENIQRFVTNPQAFNELFGYNPMPKQTGFAAGATGLPPQSPFGGGILNPKNEGYEEGYQQGEPVAIAAMAAPGYGSAAKFAAPKAYQKLENYMIKSGGMLPMMAGPESAIWEPEKQFKASLMESKGVSPQEIRSKTGLVRGLDQQWRTEISDLWSHMKDETPGGSKTFGELYDSAKQKVGDKQSYVGLQDVLSHDELEKAYPGLFSKDLASDIFIKTHEGPLSDKGAYKQSTNTISINKDLTPEQAKSTLLHELQHVIQGKEGWNRGANYGMEVRKYVKEQENIMSNIEDLNGQMKEALKADNMDKYRQLMTSRDVLSRKYTNINPEQMGYEDYVHHAGEAEARLVQRRMHLGEQGREQHFPYEHTGEFGYGLDIHPDEAIVTTKHPSSINTQEYDYRGEHTAPHKTEDNAPGHQLDKIFPDDIYGPNAHRYYGHGNTTMDKDTMSIMQSVKGKPEQELKVYRAVPKEHAGEDIYPGDWVTPNLDYAEQHGQRFENGYHILEKTVPAKHIWTDANSIHEFGYDPSE